MLEDILIVDGDVSARDTFYEILTSIGYKVTCVPNGNEAIIRVERERPALVIINSEITKLDCYETMSKIREFDPEIKFVLLSKDVPSKEIKDKALNIGVLAVVKKDFSTHLMMKEILGVLKESALEFKKESRHGRILIVDDEFEIRNMLSNFLSMKGYSVSNAGSGEEALLSIKTQKPDLVFSDIRMPGMDGLMVLRKIKEIDSSIKVVMLTAIEDKDLIAEANNSGALDYLIKPCGLMKLDALVLSILPR